MSNYILSSDELYHYGVKGMKWGIRRYQNENGTLTREGKKRAKQEYKADNKKAFELGRDATITGLAVRNSVNRSTRLAKKYAKRIEKDPDGATRKTKSLREQLDASNKSTEQLRTAYENYKSAAESHCKSLMNKYGNEAVSSIKYKDVKSKSGKISTINERTNTLSDYAVSGLSIVGAMAATMMGAPVGIYTRPLTAGEKASRIEQTVFASNWSGKKPR